MTSPAELARLDQAVATFGPKLDEWIRLAQTRDANGPQLVADLFVTLARNVPQGRIAGMLAVAIARLAGPLCLVCRRPSAPGRPECDACHLEEDLRMERLLDT